MVRIYCLHASSFSKPNISSQNAAAMGFVTPVLIPRLLTFLAAAKYPQTQLDALINSGQPLPPTISDIAQVQDWHGYTYVAGILVSTILGSFANYHAQLKSYALGLKIRSAFTMLIYKKALYVRSSKTRNTGQITYDWVKNIKCVFGSNVLCRVGI